MLKALSSGALLLFATSAVALRAPGVVKTELKDGTLSAKLAPGYHFNEKAPNVATVDGQVLKPAKLSKTELVFNGIPSDFKSASARVFVCDDAVTFCEPQTLEIKTADASVNTSVPAETVTTPQDSAAAAPEAKPAPQANAHGFFEDDYAYALALALKEKKLLLIDFSARWCPGCVRLEQEIFDTKEFKNATKRFVKLKLDVDRFENGVIAEKFKVTGIPTLLVVNGKQQEVDRIVDYQPNSVLKPFFAAVSADPSSLTGLMKRAKAGKDQKLVLRAGKRLLASNRAAEAADLLELVKPAPPELVAARVKAAAAKFKDDKKHKAEYVKVLNAAIDAEPESSRSLLWRAELAPLVERDEKIDLRKDGLSIADDLLKDKEAIPDAVKNDMVGEFTGFESFMIAIYRADLIEVSGASADEVAAGWKKAAQVAREAKIPPSKTGTALRQLIVLTRAKLFDEAEKLSAEMLKHDPGNPEIERRRLRILLEQKKYDQAIATGQDVLKKSYGRNEIWVAEVLAKALVQSGKKEDAKTLIDSYLGRAEMDWPNMKESKKTLEDLKKQIGNG